MYLLMGILCCLQTKRFYLEERGLAEVMVAHLLESSGRWFDSNRLVLNRNKTRRLRCTLNRTSSSNHSIVNLVGFILDPKLTWDDSTKQMCKRLSRVLFLLKKLVVEEYLVMDYQGLNFPRPHQGRNPSLGMQEFSSVA